MAINEKGTGASGIVNWPDTSRTQGRNRIFVNAASAKNGGARTIVESFVSFAATLRGCEFVIIAGFKEPQDLPKNIRWKYKRLNGFAAAFYNLFFVIRDYRRYRCSGLLSFNNMNCIFLPAWRKKTYFHQLKALDKSLFELKLFIIRCYLYSSREAIIVQSREVKQAFAEIFKARHSIKVAWPGIAIPPVIDCEWSDQRSVLVPVTNPESQHKNFRFVEEVAEELGSEWTLLVTAKGDQIRSAVRSNIKFIGPQARSNLFAYYRGSSSVLFASTHETVGLPIFESLSVNTPVVVFGAPYVRSLQAQFGIRSGLGIIECPAEAADQIRRNASRPCRVSCDKDFHASEWRQIFD